MVFPSIHPSIATLLSAVTRRDRAAVAAMLGPDAKLTHAGIAVDGGDAIGAWLAALPPEQALKAQPLNVATRGSASVLSVIFSPLDGDAGCLLQEYKFSLDGELITAIDAGAATPLAVPAAVLDFVRAANAADQPALLASFADDALVNDQLRDYWGKAEIAGWAETDIFGDRLTMAVVKIVQHYDEVILTAHIDGAFDKRGLPDPLVLTFYFSARGGKIVQLIILRNDL